MRLDLFLKKHLPNYSRSFVQKLIQEEKVMVNGEIPKQAYLVKGGDRIMLTIPPLAKLGIKPESIPLDILWEDEHLLVVNKPPGMLAHPVTFDKGGTLVNALLFHCHHLSRIGGILRQGIVHRLDKDTSGAMVVAKDDLTHLALATQFQKRVVKKIYLALVKGKPPQEEGRIETKMGRNPRNGRKMTTGRKFSREAITHYRVLKRWGRWSLLELHPKTGRTHQIRLQLHSINCLLAGDKLYGGKRQDFPYKLERGMLHAKTLGLFHPQRRKWMEFEAPLPMDMRKALEAVFPRKSFVL